MEIANIEFYEVDHGVVFIVENLDETKIKDAQIEYLQNKDNEETINKLVNIFREMNDSRFISNSDNDIINIIIETIYSGEFLYEYAVLNKTNEVTK